MTAMIYHQVWGLEDEARAMYRELGEEDAWAEACIDCGECEPKCPQQIPIPRRLREAADILGG
jgi:predicted aldo/keto reductase-like oxidoreductase